MKLKLNQGLSRGIMPLVLMAVIAVLPRLSTERSEAKKNIIDGSNTEWVSLVDGSVYDGDTLRVERAGEEMKIRFCGIDAPEKDQPGGIESRDHLRSLVAQGDGSIGVVAIEKDRYGRTVADLFVMRRDGSEIHLNSQMVADGHAYHYARYSGNCPQPDLLARAEEIAKDEGGGLWQNPNAERPWDYRKR